jgi:VanZ family protein
MKTRVDARYSLFTVAYVVGIYWLSSIPDLGAQTQPPLTLLVLNLGHAPLFAGLAFCVLKSVSTSGEVRWAPYVQAFAVCGACGALDEWHQCFVPGRYCSMGDFLVDLVGIGGMLFVLRFHARRRERRRVVSAPSPLIPFRAACLVGPAEPAFAASTPKMSSPSPKQ